MLYISREYVQDSLDKSVAPAAVCDSGETVVFQTRDCYDDSVTCGERPLGDRRDALGNPATGPLYIHGARPGDILKVEILKIELRSWGVMCSSFSYGAFAGRFPDPKAVIFEIIDNKIRFDEKLTLDCCPMIGVIGTAPVGRESARRRLAVMEETWIAVKSVKAPSCICRSPCRVRCCPWEISML